MQVLTYTIGKDKRALVKNATMQKFKVDYETATVHNWVQARQYEDGLRSVIVNMQNEDGTPYDITDANPVFEGLIPDGIHKVLDSKHGILLDPQQGQFRFDFPKRAFAIAGSYKQAFFRLYRDGQCIATLEFDLEVLADKVISGLIPSDYITPFEDLYGKLETIVDKSDKELTDFKANWDKTIHDAFSKWTDDYIHIQQLAGTLQARLNDIAEQIKANNLVTEAMLKAYAGEPVMLGIAHLQLKDELFPVVQGLASKYGAGIGGAGEHPAGGSNVYRVNCRPVFLGDGEVEVWVSPDNIKQFINDFAMASPDASIGGNFAYVYSGDNTISVEFKGAKVQSFHVSNEFNM